jgi:hypothetical protein
MAQKPRDPVITAAVAIIVVGAITVSAFLIFDYAYQTGVFGKKLVGGVELKK